LRKLDARRATYASAGEGIAKWVRTLRTMNGAVASWSRILSRIASVLHTFVSPRKVNAGPAYARDFSKMPVRTRSALGTFFGAWPVCMIWRLTFASIIAWVMGRRHPARPLAAA